jgi:hypothetical protein
MRRQLAIVVCLLHSGCATLLGKGDIEELKPAIESFHQKLRWKDFRVAAEGLVPERRTSFIKARVKTNDERDLFITDFQLEDARISDDVMKADAVSTIKWYRLPSTTEETATVTSMYVWRDKRWLLESQDSGPFPDLLPAPPLPGVKVKAP